MVQAREGEQKTIGHTAQKQVSLGPQNNAFNDQLPLIHITEQLLQLLRALKNVDLFLMEKADRQSLPLHSHTQTCTTELPWPQLLSETQSRFQGSGHNRLDLWNHRKDIKIYDGKYSPVQSFPKEKNPYQGKFRSQIISPSLAKGVSAFVFYILLSCLT